MNDQPKKSPSPVIKKTGMTATIKLGTEEVQVVSPELILQHSTAIDKQEKRIRNLEDQLHQTNQALRHLSQELQKIKSKPTSIFKK